MKPQRFLLPTAAVGALAALLLPTDSEAYSLNGSSLGLTQRDVRIFNNFSDATATDNQQQHAMFPGYVGAELSIWKACIEWGSILHGDGSGDSTQPNGLGSGGANFDISWQGNATSVGGVDDNVHSELTGDGGSVYAFAEGPYSNGWRVRYYQNPWVWEDGPGVLPNGRVDIQGIATHEYGHCVGLGHSDNGQATMFASTSMQGSINQRTLGTDDSLGLQAIYGVAAVNKVLIIDVVRVGNSVEITGANFDTLDNEVWFTQAATGGSGTPVKVFGVDSSGGGTFLSLSIPGAAGPGDVLVRRSGSGGDDLSNAFPFDPEAEAPIETFCNGADNAIIWCPCGNSGDADTGCDNSAKTGGVGMAVTYFDPDKPAAVLTCTGYPPAGAPTAIIIRSPALEVGIPPVFGDGIRCVSTANLVRLAATVASGGTSTHAFGHGAGAGPGTFFYQAWYRNTPASYCTPESFNLSSGVALTWP